ncbi:LysR family transcriptional regulator [Castellaniella sp.]|uniref:LysR family transcriptional regulator n=1 Tax=Castellaniella sp. TaxID=1955812 RepID=UPI002AFE2BC9|nr:LysR family transcriptional regulator [Castellaniella sp.]
MSKTRESIDTHLLRILQILLTEQSVSRAAIKLGLSQPAISNSLRRLRDITGDPILVRSKTGMVPTERGLDLLAHANNALSAIAQITDPPGAFDPATTTREFHLGAPDYLDAMFLPNIAEILRREAPHAKFIVHPINSDYDYASGLEDGGLDVVIGNWLEPPPQMHMARLFDDEVVCMVGSQNPFARRDLSLKQYLELPHLAPFPYVSERQSFIDGYLASQGLRRNIQMTIPYFGQVAGMLLRTDLIFTTGRQFAQHYARYLPITILPSPFEFPPMRFYLLWHRRCHGAPEVIWLRQCIVRVAAMLQASLGNSLTKP